MWRLFNKDGAEKKVINTLAIAPRVKARQTAAFQSFADGALTQVRLDVADWDTDSFLTTGAAPRITIPAGKGGLYQFFAHIEFPNPAQAHALVTWWRKNGTTILGGNSSEGNYGPNSNSVMGTCGMQDVANPGDYYEFFATYQSGAARTALAAYAEAAKIDGAVVNYVEVATNSVGKEIVVGQKVTDTTTVGGSFAAGADVLSADLSFTADGVSSYIVEAIGMGWANSGAAAFCVCDLKLDGAQAAHVLEMNTPAANGVVPFNPKTKITPAAGVHTVNFRVYTGAGTLTVYGGSGAAAVAQPLTLRVVKAS